MGRRVEREHTKDKGVAAEITRDHLAEDPKYYSKLKDAGLADELEKGLRGDWQKEGYQIRHEKPYKNKGRMESISVVSLDGVDVARFKFAYSKANNELNVLAADVHPDHQRKGIATAVYNQMESKTNLKLTPTSSQTQDARALWNQPNRPFGKSENLSKSQPQLRSIADSYNKKANLPHIQHMSQLPELDPDLAGKLAQAHTDMRHDPHHPEVKKAYTSLINETLDQYHHLLDHGYKFSPIKPGQANPYPTSKHMLHDVHANKHLWYFPTEQGFGSDPDTQDHPLLQKIKTRDGKEVPANDIFRAVHDIFGHAKEGNGFGPKGEEAAWSHHMQMFTPDAQKALTAETRLQNHWVNWGPHKEHNRANPSQTIYAPQKAGLPPTWALTTQHFADTKKTENLEKGSAQKRAKFNPVSDLPDEHRRAVKNWVKNAVDRNLVPKLEGGARHRALHKLTSQALTRMNKDTGEREYLLFRGKTEHDHRNNDQLKGLLSFSPDPDVADRFNSIFLSRGFSSIDDLFHKTHPVNMAIANYINHVQANGHNEETKAAAASVNRLKNKYMGGIFASWVPESAIHHIPNAIGDKLSSNKMVPNYHQDEQEVIINSDHPKFKFHKFGREHIGMLQDLYQDHVASVVKTKMTPIKKFEDIAKMYYYKGTYRAENYDPEGMAHPEKPYVKVTSKSGNAVWAYKPEVASQHEKRFMDNFNKLINSQFLSSKGKQHFYKLSRQVLSDPDRHVIATGEHGHQHLRLRHLMHVMENKEGNFMEETPDGIKITSIRHSNRKDKNPEIHSWHFDGESLNFLGDQNKGKP